MSNNKGLEQLVESRLSAMQSERNRLIESWGPHINAVEKYMGKQGKSLSINDKRNIG